MINYIIKQFLIDEVKLEVYVSEDNVYLSQEQMSLLFEKDRTTIAKQIKNILKEENKEKESVCAKFSHTGDDNKVYQVDYYSLEMIIKIGYRVNINQCENFKSWAETILNENKIILDKDDYYEFKEKVNKTLSYLIEVIGKTPNNRQLLSNNNDNKDNNYEVVKYIDNDLIIDVNVSPDEDTVWLTQEDISVLFDTTKQNISLHISNILEQNELLATATVKENLTVQKEGDREVIRKIKIYNLDMILAIGYRVNSIRGITFRRWANKVLKQYLTKGYALNEERLINNPSELNKLNKVVDTLNQGLINTNNEVVNINKRVDNIEKVIKEKDLPINTIFYEGAVFDAFSLIESIIQMANEEIIVIDNYIDITVLDRLKVKKENVEVKIYTKNFFNNQETRELAINNFNNQYGRLKIEYNDLFHDRFLIIDKKEIFNIGASIKDAGKKSFAINKMSDDIINDILVRL